MFNILILVSLLFFPVSVYAETWICFDQVSKEITKMVEGDGLKFGICGLNNSNIIPDCILADGIEWNNAKNENIKVDDSMDIGKRVIFLTPKKLLKE